MLKRLILIVTLVIVTLAGCQSSSEQKPIKAPEPYHVTFEAGELSAFRLDMISTPQGIRCTLQNGDKDFTIRGVKILLDTGAGHSRYANADVIVRPLSSAEFYLRSDGFRLTRRSGLVSVDASRNVETRETTTTVRYSTGQQDAAPEETIVKKRAALPSYEPDTFSSGGPVSAPVVNLRTKR